MAYDWQKIGFMIAGWNNEAAQALAGATAGNPSYSINELAREVMDNANATNLFEVTYNNKRIGWAVMWIEEFGAGRELVLQVGEALTNTLKTMIWITPAFEAHARRNDCQSMRVHIGQGKRGMMRVFEKAGFQQAETVLRRIV